MLMFNSLISRKLSFHHQWASQQRDLKILFENRQDRVAFTSAERVLACEDFETRKLELTAKGEYIYRRESAVIEDFESDKIGVYWKSQPAQKLWSRFLYGDFRSAALFVAEGREGLIHLARSTLSDSQELFSLFKTKNIDAETFIDRLKNDFLTREMTHDQRFQLTMSIDIR